MISQPPQTSLTPVSAKWGAPEISRVHARERLLAQLDQLAPYACTWVTAPAGYGKTCLASAYAEQATVPSLWYTLERSDSDVATFFADFGAGLRAVVPDAVLLQYAADIQDPAAFARAYFKRALAHLEGSHLLVLDDYHEVAPDAPLHEVIATLIGSLPRGARLIVLSRETPPAPLARAQTYDQVARLGAEDLRLTLDEGVAIARARAIEGNADEKSIQLLLERSDGWAAGFVLLLRHPVEDPPPPETTEVLFEYFAQEVLRGADEAVRAFLLRTAWLPSMTAEMARRMTGHPRAVALLRALVKGNYFLSRTDASNALYRYHQLFRQFLLHHAAGTWSEEELVQCRRQAAAILEDEGQLDAAAALWREADDWESLTGLIRHAAPSLLAQSRTQSLDQWMGGIPDAALAERPWLLYWSGRSQLHRDPIAARGLFEQAYRSFKGAHDVEGVFLSWAAVCETYWIALDGTDPLRQWLAELEEIETRWPSLASPELETRVAFGVFYALLSNDPLHPCRDIWEIRLLNALDSDLPPDLRLMTANLLLFHYVWTMGDQGRSALVLDKLRMLAGNDAAAPLSVVFSRTWGEFPYEYCFGGSMERCRRIVEDAQAVAAERGAHLFDGMLWAIPAMAHLTDGDVVGAKRFVERLQGVLHPSRVYGSGIYYYTRAWEAWLDGRLAEAREAAEVSHACSKRLGYLHGAWRTTLALFHIEVSLGRRMQALRHLASARHWLCCLQSRLASFERALVLALLALESGSAARCHRLLRIALALGRKEGYVSIPFLTPQMLPRLCAEALDVGIELDYVRYIIRKRDLKPPLDAALSEHWPWPVKITTFGGLTLRIDDEPVRWPRKAQHKPIDLLRALVAYGGRGVPSCRLIDELWPEAEGDAATRSLKTTLHRLRKLLGREDAVQLRDGQISLNPTCVWVDRWAFEQVLEEMETPPFRTSIDQPRAVLGRTSQRLLHLYKGRFLEKSDLPCAAAPREALHRKYLRAVERLAGAFEAGGMEVEARSIYERALDVDPTAKWLDQKIRPRNQDS